MISKQHFMHLTQTQQYESLKRALTVFMVHDNSCTDLMDALKSVGVNGSEHFFGTIFDVIYTKYMYLIEYQHHNQNNVLEQLNEHERDENAEVEVEAQWDALLEEAFTGGKA